MNLINDLDTEIAFAVLIEKKHNEKIETKEIPSLIGRLNKALEKISEKDKEIGEKFLTDKRQSQIAVH